MIIRISLACTLYFPLDIFNITYSRRKCAQARLDHSAPCLGLTLFQELQTVQTKPPPQKETFVITIQRICFITIWIVCEY